MSEKLTAAPAEKEEKKYGKFDDWEIESAVRTIIEAEEIKQDAEKMKYVKPLLEEKLQKTQKAITSLQDLKDIAKSRTKG